MKRQDQAAGRVWHRAYSFGYFMLFFLLITALMLANFMIFLSYVRVDRSRLYLAAPLTLGNTIFLSLLCSLVDYLRRRFTVDRPVQRILDATNALAGGDFTVRVQVPRFSGAAGLSAIAENINKMAEELAGIETLRSDFVSNVSHELKTPLATIQNYGTLLQAPGLTEETRLEYARTLTASTRRLSELVTNILRLSKLENQQIFPRAKPYDLSEQLCECLLGFEGVWESKGLEIVTGITPDVAIEADRELLSLVWNNLFSNAMKFTPPGGKVSVRLDVEEGRAVVRVADTGCGMDDETKRHIFEKFYQGDTSHAMAGNGLGLALVKRVVGITGGEIAVDSRAGEGSVFTVRLNTIPGTRR